MSTTNPVMRYGAVARLLHWTIAALVFVQLAMGKAGFVDVEHPKTAAFMWHGSLGVLVLVLALVRILWILVRRPPAFPATMSRFGRISARTVHVSLYVLLFALPISGWLAASSEGVTINFFNVATVPGWHTAGVTHEPSAVQRRMQATPEADGAEEEDAAEEVHELLGDALLILVTLHILAALKHQFIDRDQLIQRMLPPPRSRTKRGEVPPLSR